MISEIGCLLLPSPDMPEIMGVTIVTSCHDSFAKAGRWDHLKFRKVAKERGRSDSLRVGMG